jgi:hypothetical protein
MEAVIKREVHNGKVYIATVRRGVEYTLTRQHDHWVVYTRRLALGRLSFPGVRHYKTLADMQANCKAFAGTDILEAM